MTDVHPCDDARNDRGRRMESVHAQLAGGGGGEGKNRKRRSSPVLWASAMLFLLENVNGELVLDLRSSTWSKIEAKAGVDSTIENPRDSQEEYLEKVEFSFGNRSIPYGPVRLKKK
ncbi:hypothetical protein RIF29_25206 [Crotalaria pallida]|uniref:Uncharacterized protein n=1 Tax=Crotalaria pallida TaxID=3830 RepID=A0AAN9HZ34_CROPI